MITGKMVIKQEKQGHHIGPNTAFPRNIQTLEKNF